MKNMRKKKHNHAYNYNSAKLKRPKNYKIYFVIFFKRNLLDGSIKL